MICQLLSGIDWKRERSDRLVVFLPSGTLIIDGVELASASEALLNASKTGNATREELEAQAAAGTSARIVICRYACDLLLRARALFENKAGGDLSELEGQYVFTDGSTQRLEALRAATVLCFCFDEDAAAVSAGFDMVGLSATIRRPDPSALADQLAGASWDLIVSLGPPPHHLFSRQLNQVAVGTSTKVLFASCSGLVARIGPTVIGRNLPCLECVSTRHAANGGGSTSAALSDLAGTALDGTEGAMRPLAHPAVRQLMVLHAAIESERILRGDPPMSFGGYLELAHSGLVVRREVLKVPYCSGCGSSFPERFPFDVTPLS